MRAEYKYNKFIRWLEFSIRRIWEVLIGRHCEYLAISLERSVAGGNPKFSLVNKLLDCRAALALIMLNK